MSQGDTKRIIIASIGFSFLLLGFTFFMIFHFISTEYIVMKVVDPYNPRLKELEDYGIWQIFMGIIMIIGLLILIYSAVESTLAEYHARKRKPASRSYGYGLG